MNKSTLISIILLIFFISGCASNKSFNIIKTGSNERTTSKEDYKDNISKYNLEIQNTNIDKNLIADDLSLNIPLDTSLNRFAILLEKNKIGKYALNSTKITTSYLTTKDADFELKTFDIKDNISDTIANIRREKFAYVIAIITTSQLEPLIQLANQNSDMKFYIPTIHISQLESIEVQNEASNILFGGLDYKQQIVELSQFTSDNISMFSIKNSLGKELRKYVYDTGVSVLFDQDITGSTSRFDKIIEDKVILNDTALYLNTPIVKSSLILSQLRIYELMPYPILSTQLSYNRLIFSLTQPQDRENLIIANSIINYDKTVDENSKLLGTNIDYDWINYSTCIAIDNFYAQINQSQRIFDEEIIDNQVQYKVELLKPNNHSFGLVQ
jgi:hypothetical protein